MASQSHCPVAGVHSVHGCNATPFLQAFGADPVQAPAQGTIDFPAQAGRPAPDKKKADGNAVSLSVPLWQPLYLNPNDYMWSYLFLYLRLL